MTKPINVEVDNGEILGAHTRRVRWHGWTTQGVGQLLRDSDASIYCPGARICSSYQRKMCEPSQTCCKTSPSGNTWPERHNLFRKCRYYEVTICVLLRGPEKKDSTWTRNRKESEGP